MEADVVVIALGRPNPLVPRTTYGLEVDRHGCIVADPQTGATSRAGVYAGGDIVTGAATVILAMAGAGRRAASSMHEYLQQRAVADEREAKEYRRGRGDGIAWARDYATAGELATSWRTSSRAGAGTSTPAIRCATSPATRSA